MRRPVRATCPRLSYGLAALLAAVLTLAATGLPVGTGAAAAGMPHRSIKVTKTTAPAGFGTPSGQWLRITRADGRVQLAEVFRPRNAGTYPLVVVTHGSSGLAGVQLTWAADLAKQGYVVFAGCYLDAVAGAPPHTFVPCPRLPDITTASSSAIHQAYAVLLDAAATLAGTKAHAEAAVGMSFGANVALDYNDTRLKAIIADSGYRDIPGTTASPVLLFGFTDDPAVPHAKLVAFERAQHKAGKAIEARYYRATGHVALLTTNTSHDATTRTTAFLRKHIG